MLPGFVDVHVHSHRLSLAEMQRWTLAGVTTVRDLDLGPRDMMLARRAEVAASGDPALPRLLVGPAP